MAEMINESEFLGMTEAADFLGLSKSTLYKLTFRKAIPFYKYGCFVKFKLDDLRIWKAARLVKIPMGAEMQAYAAIYCARGRR